MRQLSEIDVILEYCLGALQEVLVKLQRSLWEDGSPVPKQIIGKAQSATRWVKDSTCKSCHKLISWFSTGPCSVPLAFERKYLLGSKYIASLDQADRDRVPQKLNITELRWNCKRCAWSLPSHGFTARGCWRSYWHSCHLFSSSFSFDRQKMFVWTWHQQDLLHSFCCRTLSTFRRSIRSVRSVDVCVATALFSQTHEFSEVQVRDWIFFVFSVSVLAKMLKDVYACVCVCVCINLSWPSVRLVLCLALTNVGYVVGKKRSTSLLAKKRNQQDDRLLTAAVLRASCSRPLLCGVHIPILVEWTCCKHMANDNRTNGPNGESDTNENEMQGVESRLLS